MNRLHAWCVVAILALLALCNFGGCPQTGDPAGTDGLAGLGKPDYSGIYSGNVTTTASSVPSSGAPAVQSAYMSIAVDEDGSPLTGSRPVAVGDWKTRTAGDIDMVFTVDSVNKSDAAVYVTSSIVATISGSPASGTGSETYRYSGTNVLEYHESYTFGDSSVMFTVEYVGTLTK